MKGSYRVDRWYVSIENSEFEFLLRGRRNVRTGKEIHGVDVVWVDITDDRCLMVNRII